jgi:hypothetical protein
MVRQFPLPHQITVGLAVLALVARATVFRSSASLAMPLDAGVIALVAGSWYFTRRSTISSQQPTLR